ncbi:MAG: T9SS type A sorting domain-containing protein [Flavobacteriia bacterium]|nr:T9SS type A sorting domain-containing protein [Flavobacteriia bacterium]OJX37551.1 MAG: hypothetical protein BGO87_00895 [Flavobacteriia bacterium 40-80]
MRKRITFISAMLFCFGLSLKLQAQDNYNLCGQHSVQSQLPYSEERELRMSKLDQEQKAMQEFVKTQQPTRQIYKIPVVFHILHYNGTENISNEQIFDAMEVLNRDYRKLNADAANVYFDFNESNPNAVATPADIEVEFVLATKAPDGTCFNGITRTISPKTITSGDGFVQLDEVIHGNDVYKGIWPSKNYMNVIVVKNSNNTGGYTFMPGSFNPDNMYASIWVNCDYVGRFGTSTENKSRVLTHEVGHWLNLHHTWGGNNNPMIACGDDEVDDTPETRGTTSCNLNENYCGVRANVENYMDYSYCSKMFTHGQKDRMRACLMVAPRNTLWTPENQVLTGIDGSSGLCAVDFGTAKERYCVGESVQFTDYSTQGQTSWSWELEGASPAVSNQQNPLVTYATPGVYKVKLTASDGTTTLSKTKEAFIRINPESVLPYFQGFEYVQNIQEIEEAVIHNITPDAPTFEVVNTAAATDNKSLCLYNFYATEESTHEYISPVFDLSQLSSSDKVTLSFKYAYRKKAAENNEKLIVTATKDCGTTWLTRREISGNSLSSEVLSSGFVPVKEDFKTVHVTGITGTLFSENFQFRIAFEASSGNNLYLDDINFYRGAPSDENVLGLENLSTNYKWNIFPNPANKEVTVDFSLSQAEKITLKLTDLAGKTVFENAFYTAEGANEILLDVATFTPGIYLVHLGNQIKKLVVE